MNETTQSVIVTDISLFADNQIDSEEVTTVTSVSSESDITLDTIHSDLSSIFIMLVIFLVVVAVVGAWKFLKSIFNILLGGKD